MTRYWAYQIWELMAVIAFTKEDDPNWTLPRPRREGPYWVEISANDFTARFEKISEQAIPIVEEFLNRALSRYMKATMERHPELASPWRGGVLFKKERASEFWACVWWENRIYVRSNYYYTVAMFKDAFIRRVLERASYHNPYIMGEAILFQQGSS